MGKRDHWELIGWVRKIRKKRWSALVIVSRQERHRLGLNKAAAIEKYALQGQVGPTRGRVA